MAGDPKEIHVATSTLPVVCEWITESPTVRNILQPRFRRVSRVFPNLILTVPIGECETVASTIVVCGRIRKINGIKAHLQESVIQCAHRFVAKYEHIDWSWVSQIAEFSIPRPSRIIIFQSLRLRDVA